MDRAYNFAAGPACMPEPVLKKAQSELMNWHGCGMSVMEMSHRGSQFAEIHTEAKARFKRLLNIPDTHEVLFLQG
ncbi:MAG TPA: aminotransferase class V-fold PLP-dependent enzyme, partial [Candidatus Scatomorpha merdigallinarum]|nr:aminotransferase class V-fold PLP-dependent enzyme [Candidatus Scatomorpha merdigallinarum]